MKKVFSGLPTAITAITADNAATEVQVLIAAIAKVLGIENVNPKHPPRSDNLYALMGFDDTLARALVLSVMGHFNVLSVLGGDRMVTVGDAIDFALGYCDTDDAA